MSLFKKVLVTGGAGYVGSRLVPKLLSQGYQVSVLDLFAFGDVLPQHPQLTQIKGDLRDQSLLKEALKDIDVVIHLACISNDPSFELNPDLGKSINYDAFIPLVDLAQDNGVQRFIYASSSSVYGIKEEDNVTEDLPLQPLTDYSKYKALCEEVLLEKAQSDFCPLIIRPATVCGYAPRLRLDLTVNILTNHAITNNKIRVFGGEQKRPNIHIEDMTDLYIQALQWETKKIYGKTYNAGYHNHKVKDIAQMVKNVVGDHVEIVTEPTDDHRSYHISSEKIKAELGFTPQHTIEDAIRDLVQAFNAGQIPHSMTEDNYYNIRVMKRFEDLMLKV